VRFVLWFSNALYWFDMKVIDGFIGLLEHTGIWLSGLAAWFDRYIIDGTLHLIAGIVQLIGNFARRFQGGKIQYYLFSMLLAVIAVFILKLIWTR